MLEFYPNSNCLIIDYNYNEVVEAPCVISK